MPLIEKGRISYIFIFVRDLESMLSFYRDTLGFELRFSEPGQCAFLDLQAGAGPQIALYTGRETAPPRRNADWFVVVDVDDLDTVAAKLRERRDLTTEGIFEVPYGRALQIVDPEGNVVQFHEPTT